MSLPMLRPHCSDILNKGLIKYQTSASILLHGDPNNKFQLELEEFIFCGLIFTCYWAWHEDMFYDVLNESISLLCSSLCEYNLTVVVGSPTPMSNFSVVI